ncbi:LppX_LprAFG lipoprotein [Mycobacterium sp. PS03-16]|uniref:LppX_LprAFG lipoprotein n=1 Tax=Mycobacterium sp. PS03-16 TaxID=2559611 RepID=UPI00107464E6|nr:LppX_LprAFG lipoprotein [Mycobacterium sp. PS03-16]TFV58923.1 LppX_LprAFG lipoprotein [Mycobacterium sp. PS03-16]
MPTSPRHAVKALTAVLLAAALFVAGCSSSSETSDAPLPDAATLLQDATQTTRDLQSVHLLLTVQGTIEELPIESLEGDLTNTPAVAAAGKANINFLGQRLEGVEFVVADGNLYGAITAGSFQDFGPAADIYDVAAILSPDKGLANVLTNFNDPTAEGRENVSGVDTVRVTGTVTPEAVNAIAPQLNATGPVPATAWIEEGGSHNLAQIKLEPTPGNSVTMTLSDWGKQVNVTKPAV